MPVAERRHNVLDGAKDDIGRAVHWYEEQAEGAGASLLALIDDAIRKIIDAPQRWSRIDADYQRYLLRRYPYSVIYRVRDEVVFIIAVAHHSREPGYWRVRE